MKVTAIVELSKDGLFGIYISDELPGFGLNGTGNSVEEAKRDMLSAYEEIKEMFAEQGKEIPELTFSYNMICLHFSIIFHGSTFLNLQRKSVLTLLFYGDIKAVRNLHLKNSVSASVSV